MVLDEQCEVARSVWPETAPGGAQILVQPSRAGHGRGCDEAERGEIRVAAAKTKKKHKKLRLIRDEI